MNNVSHYSEVEMRGEKNAGSASTFFRKVLMAVSKGKDVETPCGGCTACCRDENLFVNLKENELSSFPEKHFDEEDQQWKLDRKPNGECVFLLNDKCSIRERRPRCCREYDCRVHLYGAILPNGATLVAEAASKWTFPTTATRQEKILVIAIRMMFMDNAMKLKLEGFDKYLGAAEIFFDMHPTLEEKNAVFRVQLMRNNHRVPVR